MCESFVSDPEKNWIPHVSTNCSTFSPLKNELEKCNISTQGRATKILMMTSAESWHMYVVGILLLTDTQQPFGYYLNLGDKLPPLRHDSLRALFVQLSF